MRNILFVFPDATQEAMPVIATIVKALQDNPAAFSFLKEACNLLWILVAEEESCHSKIVSLDGLNILMKIMESTEQNREDSELQRAAQSCFRILAANSS